MQARRILLAVVFAVAVLFAPVIAGRGSEGRQTRC